jgi:hypothetical protein
MDLSKTERNVVKLFFHPRLIKYLDRYVGRNQSHHRVEFACNHSQGIRQRMCTNGHLQMLSWMYHANLHIVAGNCGVVDMDDTHVLALDMILAHPPGCMNAVDAPLTLCTVVLNEHASKCDTQRAHDHVLKLHSIMNDFYHLRCRSVLLSWNVDDTFSEVWFPC